MPTHLRSARPKARKTHQCAWCLITIEPGTVYTRDSLAYDGHAYDWISCTDCDDLVSVVYRSCDYPDEGVNAEDYYEWAEAYADDPVHGEAARAYLARRGGAST